MNEPSPVISTEARNLSSFGTIAVARRSLAALGTAALRGSTLLLIMLIAVGCGFHLRGQGQALLPPSLTQLRLATPGADPNGVLVAAVRQNLGAQPHLKLVDDTAAPVLSLVREHVESQVLSVRTTTAKAAEYQLRYTVEFDVRDGAGQPLLALQRLRLTRDYTFDPAQVLAKEHEERELLRDMARDAANQIVRRMGRMKPAA